MSTFYSYTTNELNDDLILMRRTHRYLILVVQFDGFAKRRMQVQVDRTLVLGLGIISTTKNGA